MNTTSKSERKEFKSSPRHMQYVFNMTTTKIVSLQKLFNNKICLTNTNNK